MAKDPHPPSPAPLKVQTETDGELQVSRLRPSKGQASTLYTAGHQLVVAMVTIILIIITKQLHPLLGRMQFLFFLLSQTCLLTQLPRLQKASLHFHLQNQYEIPRGLV